jgi:hypothetical protein
MIEYTYSEVVQWKDGMSWKEKAIISSFCAKGHVHLSLVVMYL